jgi:hypothetical protein
MSAISRDDLKALWIKGYAPTEVDYENLFDSFFNTISDTISGTGLKTISKENTFTPAIIFDKDEKYFNEYTQTSELTISLDENTNGQGSSILAIIRTNGDDILFPSDWCEIKNEYVNDTSLYGLAILYDGTNYQYSLYFVKIIDTAPPILSSATIEDATRDELNLVFDENVTITTSGWSIATDGASLSISSVSGSGTTTPKFILSREVVNGETITLDYSSTTGSVVDSEGNELETFNDYSVTNNVLSDEQDLNFTIYSQNMAKVGTVYEAGPSNAFGYLISDETFAGDFEAIIDLTDSYAISGRQLSFGVNISTDTSYSGYAGWEFGCFFNGGTSVQFYKVAVLDGSATIAQGDKIKIKRTGSTLYVDRYNSGSWSNIKTVTGTYSNTFRIQFTGYGDGTGRAKVYNPKYL